MAKNTAADKYFEALTESYDAIIEAIKAGNERGFRVSNNLLAEAQRGQREADVDVFHGELGIDQPDPRDPRRLQLRRLLGERDEWLSWADPDAHGQLHLGAILPQCTADPEIFARAIKY